MREKCALALRLCKPKSKMVCCVFVIQVVQFSVHKRERRVGLKSFDLNIVEAIKSVADQHDKNILL